MNLKKWTSATKKFTDKDFPTTDAIYWADIPFEAASLVASNS